MKYTILVAVCLVAAGCITTPSVGSSVWHQERTAEIEQAYDAWEIDEEEYLRLRTETDQIRSDYLTRLEQRRRSRVYVGFGYGYHHHHHAGHFGYYPDW